jgi:hypothetical protein
LLKISFLSSSWLQILWSLAGNTTVYKSYVFWTVHHLNSWIKRETNLMSLAILFPYLMLNNFRMLIHPFSGACDLFAELFHGLCCSGKVSVGVTLFG